MRSVIDWVGKTDDTVIPPRVRVRVFLKFDGVCQECGVKIVGKKWICDHRRALINGGKNCEGNLGPIHEWCDKKKTAKDVAEKAVTYRVRKRHLGIRKPSRFPGSRDSKYKKRMDGSVVLR